MHYQFRETLAREIKSYVKHMPALYEKRSPSRPIVKALIAFVQFSLGISVTETAAAIQP